jgi:hypothetical protein
LGCQEKVRGQSRFLVTCFILQRVLQMNYRGRAHFRLLTPGKRIFLQSMLDNLLFVGTSKHDSRHPHSPFVIERGKR